MTSSRHDTSWFNFGSTTLAAEPRLNYEVTTDEAFAARLTQATTVWEHVHSTRAQLFAKALSARAPW